MSGTKKNKYIIVGGVPRSGTTLVQKILNSHSKIYGGPEYDNLPHLAGLYKRFVYSIRAKRTQIYHDEKGVKDCFSDLIDKLLDPVRKRNKAEYLSEKTPANLLYFDELIQILPNAKFVIVVRDPRANIASFKKVYQRAQDNSVNVGVGRNLFEDINTIEKYYYAAERVIVNNPENHPIIVQYEKLITSQEKVVSELFIDLEIPFEGKILDENLSKPERHGLLTDQVWYTDKMMNKGIDKSRVDGWRVDLPEWKQFLTFLLLKNNPFMKRLNYFDEEKGYSISCKIKAIIYYIARHPKPFSIFGIFSDKLKLVFKLNQ